MMGLSASITPTSTGNLFIVISGDVDNSANSDGVAVQIRTGTGTPPANGAALTGTQRGGLVNYLNGTNNASIIRVPFSLNAIATGSTLNTAVWIDISVAAVTGGTARVRNISISVIEI